MSSRVTRWAPVCALVLTAPAAAQERGTIEVGVLTRYVDFDNSLGLDNTFGFGGRVGYYVGNGVAVELGLSRTSADRIAGGGTATYTPLSLRAVYNGTVGARLDALVGGGFVFNWYGDVLDASDRGFSTVLGLRYRASDRFSLRLGTDADVMFHTADDSPFDFYTGNWGFHLGATVRLTPGGGS